MAKLVVKNQIDKSGNEVVKEKDYEIFNIVRNTVFISQLITNFTGVFIREKRKEVDQKDDNNN